MQMVVNKGRWWEMKEDDGRWTQMKADEMDEEE